MNRRKMNSKQNKDASSLIRYSIMHIASSNGTQVPIILCDTVACTEPFRITDSLNPLSKFFNQILFHPYALLKALHAL
jgi:hypothetical protein